ncbi:acylphosphatase [Saprospiraceae bacterium]|nr:acylphosphatase [Saprospiraceae bacterium]
MEAYNIVVIGIVQGVGFRYYTKIVADKYQLQGTVQNLSNGNVKIYVKGKQYELLRFLEWCHEGPSSAQVDRLEYTYSEVRNIDDFKIIR